MFEDDEIRLKHILDAARDAVGFTYIIFSHQYIKPPRICYCIKSDFVQFVSSAKFSR